jgi:hypothetical protein
MAKLKVPLDRPTYEAIVRAALRSKGVPDASIDALLKDRWPIIGATSVIGEVHGRGLIIAEEDVLAFLAAHYKQPELLENLDRTLWTPGEVERLIDWCMKNGRGRLSPIGEKMLEHPEVPIMIAAMGVAEQN